MPFELARCGLPNIAAIVALALVPLVALPMHRHHVSAKAQTVGRNLGGLLTLALNPPTGEGGNWCARLASGA